jgi:hypothetical protein
MRAWWLLALLAIHAGCATAPEKTCAIVGGWQGFPRRQMCWNSYQEAMAALTHMKKEAEDENAGKETEWLTKQPQEVREAWLKAKEDEATDAENAAKEETEQKTEEQTAALGTMMDSASRLGHSSDAAMDRMVDSSRQFSQKLNRLQSERRSIDPSPAVEQGSSFNRSTLPYGIQGSEVPIEELDQYVPQQ